MGRKVKTYILDAIIDVAPDNKFIAKDLVQPLEEVLNEKLHPIRIGHHLRTLVARGIFKSKKLKKRNIYWRSEGYARI